MGRSKPSSGTAKLPISPPSRPSHLQLIMDRTLITEEVYDYEYAGSGTTEDPYVVDWIPDDPRKGYNFSPTMKWSIVMICAFSTLASSLSATIFAGAVPQVVEYFHVNQEVAILTVCLFVLGFAVGPVVWGPLSELYGRQAIYLITMGGSVLFEGTSIACNNHDVAALLVLRFLAGSFSSAAISNSPAIVSDVFVPAKQGLAIMTYMMFPFLGPTLGPICGSFLGAGAGWRWVNVLCTVFFAVMFILGLVFLPETYAPYILRRRAAKLSKVTGKVYISKLDLAFPPKSVGATLSTAIKRPMAMAVFEPISAAMALWAALIYGTLYLIFSGFPIIFVQHRHWSQGLSGLAYVGIMVGQILGVPFYVVLELKYRKKISSAGVASIPEMRLEPAMWAAVMMPISLFWFAFTSYRSVHWIVGLVGTIFFGLGNVLVFISMTNYIIEVYSLFAATASATNAMARASFAFAFPLFTTYMYENLGPQWASSIPAFLALAFAPVPFLLFKFGPALRARSKFANEAKAQLAKLQEVRQRVEVKLEENHAVAAEKPASVTQGSDASSAEE